MPQGISIVFEKLIGLVRARGFRVTVFATILPFFGVVAAFGIAPNTVTEQIAVKSVIEDIALAPVSTSESSAEQTYWREERIQRGETIGSLLTRLHIEDAKASQFLRASSEARGLRQLLPGRLVRAETSEDGRLVQLRYSTGVMMLVVKPEGETFRISEQVAPLERRIVMRSGQIRSSLYAATDAAQLTDSVADQLTQMFSTDIDFHKDLRRGDRFTVVYEMYYDDGGEPIRSGRLLGAEFVNQGKPYQAVWFQHGNGQGDYYSLDGRPIRKPFLRSPLEFSRITSGFTPARFHPILQRWRAHTGVDYAAATGTGVKATADGVVEFAGRNGGYGNVIVLRHQSKYTTLYGHLSAFARGVRAGARVAQGSVIGYVGATGLATGPHLHYELRINDVYQDPLRVAIPEALPITAEYRAAFDAIARPMAQRLGLLRTTNLARLD